MASATKALVIWDFDEVPPRDADRVLLWQGFGMGGDSNVVSVLDLVEADSDHLRREFMSFVADIGNADIDGKTVREHLEIRPGLSLWWMTPIAERCNIAGATWINDAIKLLAAVRWLTSHTIQIIELRSRNQSLALCLQRWCDHTGTQFLWNDNVAAVTKPPWRRAHRIAVLFHRIRAIAWLLRHVIQRWPLRGKSVEAWTTSPAQHTFVSYLLNIDADCAARGDYQCGYWGPLSTRLDSASVATRWLHLFVPHRAIPASKNAAHFLKNLNARTGATQTHCCLDSFLSRGLVFRVFSEWFLTQVRARRFTLWNGRAMAGPVDLWPLASAAWMDGICGRASIAAILNVHLFERALSLIQPQSVGVFLQENQPWEAALLHAWRQGNHGRIVGYAHTTVRHWDLRYCADTGIPSTTVLKRPAPDKIVTNGRCWLDELTASGTPRDRLQVVEALRFWHLGTRQQIRRRATTSRLRVLVLGTYGKEETQLQIEMLRRAIPLIRRSCQFEFRPHPATPIDLADLSSLVSTTQSPLSVMLQLADVVFTGATTSAALDGFISGATILIARDPRVPNFSPLRGFDGATFVCNPDQLASAIDKVGLGQPSTPDIERWFCLDNRLARWREVLQLP